MDPPPFKFPDSPGRPLLPLSPERVNGTRHMPQSPSLPNIDTSTLGFKTHSRTGSDVQAMVARFNAMEIRDHREMHRRDEIAIKRAEMAREMAELEAEKAREEKEEVEKLNKRMREELRKLTKELEDGRERERKVSKRMEVLMEEFHRAKETYSHAQTLYEKEIRKARKEAFKSSSALVKLQEELKSTRNSLRVTQSSLESEKMKGAKREQEAFTAQYQLVGVQEELEKTREMVKVAEVERDALKTALKEEEVARIAAEGRIALPVSSRDDDEFGSPVRSPRKPQRSNSPGAEGERLLPAKTVQLKVLQQELEQEKLQRQRAEGQIEFMKMECQFLCCSCRVAEQHGAPYIHDGTYEREIQRIKATVPIMTPPVSEHEDAEMDDARDATVVAADALEQATRPDEIIEESTLLEPQTVISFDPESGTFRSVQSPEKRQGKRVSDAGDLSGSVSKPQPTSSEQELAIETTRTETAELPGPASPIQVNQRTSLSQRLSQPDPVTIPTVTTLKKTIVLDKENRPPTPDTSVFEPSTPDNFAPHTPIHREIRTITTTTTIPIAFSPEKPSHMAATPSMISHGPLRYDEGGCATVEKGTTAFKVPLFDREAALEQIRMRRGRARSIAEGRLTPRKQMVEGVGIGGRRDISAPANVRTWGQS